MRLNIPPYTSHDDAMKLINKNLQDLTELNCSYTRITSLPDLSNLTELICYNTGITSLPDLPKLTYLYCYNTGITSLPDMPKLKVLDCDFITLINYHNLLKTRKSLIHLVSIQQLELNSTLGRLKDINPNGFNLSRLVKDFLI
jgi:Leucine-rich repeat (LRR) protein